MDLFRSLIVLGAIVAGFVCRADAGDTPDVSKIFGRIQVVESFPDYKVKIVESFPDLRVQTVDSFPDRTGRWRFVKSFPDYKIQFVESFPDFTIQFVESFPGTRSARGFIPNPTVQRPEIQNSP
jgi:hypothetical protein